MGLSSGGGWLFLLNAEGAKGRGGAEKRGGMNAKGAKSSKGSWFGWPARADLRHAGDGVGSGICMAPGEDREKLEV